MTIDWLQLYIDYAQVLWIFTASLSFLLGISYCVKAYQRRDLTILFMGLARFAFSAMWLWLALYPDFSFREQRVIMKETMIFIMFLADIVSSAVFFITRHYQVEIDLQKANAQIKKLEDKNHFILEQSPVGIYQYSIATWKFTYVNPEFSLQFGLTPEEFRGRLVFQGMDPNDAKMARESVLKRLKENPRQIHCQTMRVTKTDGSVIALDCESRIVFNGEATVLGYARLAT
jgi:PAS domain S-box-containing protein